MVSPAQPLMQTHALDNNPQSQMSVGSCYDFAEGPRNSLPCLPGLLTLCTA